MAGVYDLAFRPIRDFPKQYFYILIHKMSCHGKKKWSVAESFGLFKRENLSPSLGFPYFYDHCFLFSIIFVLIFLY